MRPDQAAFRELDALVRRLTEQVAVFRRRALTAEARVRELEHGVLEARAQLTATRQELAVVAESREHALAAAREASAEARSAREALAERERLAPAADLRGAMGPGDAAGDATPAVDPAMAGENARLVAQLAEARVRTSRLADRVRFLRQQMLQGADR